MRGLSVHSQDAHRDHGRIMAVDDGRELARITQVRAVAFSPDSKLLATASADSTARIVAVADGHELARVIHDDWVSAVAFSPDGKLLATGSTDRTARIVAVADGRELATNSKPRRLRRVQYSSRPE